MRGRSGVFDHWPDRDPNTQLNRLAAFLENLRNVLVGKDSIELVGLGGAQFTERQLVA
ncbi:MAG: hypothetical protein IT422_02045 [Pirellulaceae bacterium]|nr:hypothetical protein [Pirellulaceae bacterium]